MLLSKPAFQLSVLDSIADNKEVVSKYNVEYVCYKKLQEQLLEKQNEYEKSRAEEDYIRFQLNQFADLKLTENEDIELENLQKKLSNVSEIKQNLWQISSTLNGEENSILEQLKKMARRIEHTQQPYIQYKQTRQEIQRHTHRCCHAEADELPFRQVEQHLGFDFGDVLGDGYIRNRITSLMGVEDTAGQAAGFEQAEAQKHRIAHTGPDGTGNI